MIDTNAVYRLERQLDTIKRLFREQQILIDKQQEQINKQKEQIDKHHVAISKLDDETNDLYSKYSHTQRQIAGQT